MLDRIDHGNGIRELRLNRPPANAMDPALVNLLRASITQAPRDGVRALILSGREGEKAEGDGGLHPAIVAMSSRARPRRGRRPAALEPPETVARIRVLWPSGVEQWVEGPLEANRPLEIREP